jgi:hypothetical protein
MTLQVIPSALEIEPDDHVPGAMALRLGFIAERCKNLRHRAMWRTRNKGNKCGETAVET